ncbi:hypothetical protein GFL39_08710 [Rhizobium leguminosarum bv. viciae]|nr:hypothetical protein [Rhizobium leguminosarum bv. viciae]NKL05041.1 hypothetical protein [Rhizobium leguminosarum bv. viciae]NKL81681.1 hypothetical protein [Rhizobium leguminosarum bv. viciae]NKL91180.1 hypothetical protein [Rhizobium leguminosarum bv. viciae]NKM91212.1 hypothetical protein [Rhizobium leguminosarum bv. viciae]
MRLCRLSSLSCAHVVFLIAVFRQAWFVCGVQNAISQTGEMDHWQAGLASALPRSGRRTDILKEIAG